MTERYARQLNLPHWTPETQQHLAAARVLVVGAGGLGSAVLPYLVAAGIGLTGIVEDDRVDLTNLQRQVLYDTQDIGVPKAEAASRRLAALNPDVEIRSHRTRLEPGNAAAILAGYDLVVDCTDNSAARELLNRTCLNLEKPWIHAAVSEYFGQVTTLLPGGPCWQCLSGTGAPADPPPAGILGPVAGLIGSVQATEALKQLTGTGRLLVERLLVWDALLPGWAEFSYRRNPDCWACGRG
ncbi:MAG: HesA/MoeB/ThiF family protein [Candidatus Desulforudis sp.]|nr:HesA/MoeB/ThiF family protein [Desulforudis sp.]